MTATEKRAAVVKKYEEILGRNNYSQSLRDYCYKKYKNGKYYSDCSSSVSYAYKEAGYSFGILNTVGMYQSTKMQDVPVTIKNGVIQNPEILRPGDMLLFAGTDSSRAYAGYVGHVEMVGKISGAKVTLYGHGSGTPRATEMNAYCKSRYAKKTSTKLGHRGLIRVRRFIQDDVTTDTVVKNPTVTVTGAKVKITGGTVNVRSGPDTKFQVLDVAKKGETYPAVNVDGWIPVDMGSMIGWVSDKYADTVTGAKVKITGGTVNVRSGPGTKYQVLDVAKKGETYPAVNTEGWIPVDLGSMIGWVSDKYADKEG